MFLNVLMYAFPAMFMILGAYILLYRRTLLTLLGESANKLIFSFSILLFIVGALGLVLVVNNLIGYMLIWMIAALLIFFFILFVSYLLFKFNNVRPKEDKKDGSQE